MKCKCKKRPTVVDSREGAVSTRRYYTCKHCGSSFTTYEFSAFEFNRQLTRVHRQLDRASTLHKDVAGMIKAIGDVLKDHGMAPAYDLLDAHDEHRKAAHERNKGSFT